MGNNRVLKSSIFNSLAIPKEAADKHRAILVKSKRIRLKEIMLSNCSKKQPK